MPQVNEQITEQATALKNIGNTILAGLGGLAAVMFHKQQKPLILSFGALTVGMLFNNLTSKKTREVNSIIEVNNKDLPEERLIEIANSIPDNSFQDMDNFEKIAKHPNCKLACANIILHKLFINEDTDKHIERTIKAYSNNKFKK